MRSRPDDLFVLAIDAVWRPLECIKNKVTVRCACLNVCVCVCPGAVHTLGNNVVAPAKVNEQRRGQRQAQAEADRQSQHGVRDADGGEGGEGRELSVPGQDMKRVRKFATIRMLPATCAAPAATLKAIKKFKVAFKNAFHKFTGAPRCLLPLHQDMQNFDSSVCKSDSSIDVNGDGSDADADSDADCDNDSDTFPPFCCRQLVALAQNVDNF